MKFTLLPSIFTSTVTSHFFFPTLIVNGVESSEWQYIRNVKKMPTTPSVLPPQAGKQFPLDPFDEEVICGRRNDTAIPETLAVEPASDELQFRVDRVAQGDQETTIYHSGPVSVWMSRAPGDDVDGYLGDGEWFKIHSITGKNRTWYYGRGYYLNRKDELARGRTVEFTIPKSTPPGKYLLRVEMISSGVFQAFVNCAQVDIRGAGDGKPGPLFRLPYERAYLEEIFANQTYINGDEEEYDGPVPENLNNWNPHGPPVWRG